MNLLPLVKCKLQEQQTILKFLFFMALVITASALGTSWALGKGGGSHSGESLITVYVMVWGLSQTITLVNWVGKDEFWYGLPYSKTQVFMVSLFVQQGIVLIMLLSCFVVLLLLRVVVWTSASVIALVDMATCGIFLAIVFLCFFKPKETASNNGKFFVVIFCSISAPFVFLLVNSPLDLGLWPTYFALPSIVIALWVLKRSLDNLEPITWECPLLQSDVAFPSVGEVTTSSNEAVCLSGNQHIAESDSKADLEPLFSPVTRYVANTVWMKWWYLLFWVSSLFMVAIIGNGESVMLWFWFIVGMNITMHSSTAVRSLSPLPIGTHRLFLLIFGPYFLVFIFLVFLPACLGSHRNVKEAWAYSDAKGISSARTGTRKLSTNYLNVDKVEVSLVPVNQGERPPQTTRAQAAAQIFSEDLKCQYGITIPPQKLFHYDDSSKTWEVSTSSREIDRQCVEAQFYTGFFCRTSIFFFFLLGVRTVYTGGKLSNLTQKQISRPLNRNTEKSGGLLSCKEDWKLLIERVVVYLGLAVLVVMYLGLFGKMSSFNKYFCFKAFLLDHYLACWIVLIGVTALFYRLCLQAFRRVY